MTPGGRWLPLVLACVAWPAVAEEAPPRFGPWNDAPEVVHAEGPAVVRVPTAALILSGQSGGSIPLAVLATPLPAAAGELRLSVLTEIGAGAFAGDEPEIDVEVFVYALDASGHVAGSTSQRFHLERERHGVLLAGGLAVFTPVEVAPGDYTLRVLVRRLQTGELGVGSWPLTVAAADSAPVLLPPWLLVPASGRLVALPAGADAASATTAPVVFLGGRDVPYLPSASPRLEATKTFVGCLLARHAPTRGALLVARFETGGGELAAELPLAVQDRRPSPWQGLEVLWFSLRAPDLLPGRYRLRLVLAAPGADPAESPPLQVEISEPRSPRLATLAEAGTEKASVIVERPLPRQLRRLQVPPAEIENGYRAALRDLADGDEAAARERLAEVERRAVGSAPLALDELAEVEWRTLSGIAGDSWESLLPVALLHAHLLDDYEDRQAVHLTEHALRFSARLARELAARASSPEARAEAVQALAGLGGRLQRLLRLGESDELLERAAALDGDHAGVRLALAANDERRGRYPQAVAELEALLERHPEHAEARLRLALNLARVDRREEARRHLADLASVGEDWIAELAFQEGARLALLDGQPEVARGILERALRRWPGHPTAAIQLASLLDRLDRPRAARDRLRGLDLETSRPSARVLYGEWPAEIHQVEDLLAESAERRRIDLARLLGSPAVADAP